MRGAPILIALWLTAVAHAGEPTKPAARDHYRAGAAAFQGGQYTEASQHFAAAYDIEPSADLLWPWAQSERLAGNCVTAAGLYRKWAREEQTPTKVKTANDQIALCKREEKHNKAANTAVTEQPTPSPWYTNKLGGALTATGVVGVTVGVTFLALASSSHSAAKQEMVLEDFEAKLEETTLRRRIGGVSLGLGLAALGAGATIYILHDRKQRALTAGTDGRVVFVGARF